MRSFSLAVALAVVAAANAQNQGLVLANGTTAYLEAPYSASLVPTGGVTVEAWITYDSVLQPGWRFPTVLRMNSNPNQASYFLRVEAGQTQANRLLWWVGTTTGNYTVNWFFPAGSLSTWTHVAGTYDGSTLRVFANGVQVAQAAGSGAILDTGGTCRIGCGDLSISGGETWNGEIDEVRVWPFARSAAAITATMNMQLVTIPGEVSTWNLDGNGLDSSGNNPASPQGVAGFAANTLTLQPVPFPGLLPSGAGTGCSSAGLIGANSLANLGNGGFAFVGTRGPASGLGLLLLSTGTLPVPFTIFGVDVLVDFTIGVIAVAPASVLGTSEVPLAIPSTPSLVNASLASQFAWFDTSCAGGFSATGALVTVVVP
jgi:hypothetical protein